ncbi:MAG: hypothetical protein U9O55_04220 [Patescibacteria group bacterium]|nr:hypothetical protein [Patescibacteria group bacterium]
MAKKFENILSQNEDGKITEQSLDDLTEELSIEVKAEIDRARTKDKKSLGYNCVKVFNRKDISLPLRPRLFEKIENVIKKRNNNEDPDWRIESFHRHKLREERRAGQSYIDSDL